MTKIHRSAASASAAPSSIPAMTATSPAREPMEHAIDFTTRPPSSGTTGSRLKRLTSAIHAAAPHRQPHPQRRSARRPTDPHDHEDFTPIFSGESLHDHEKSLVRS